MQKKADTLISIVVPTRANNLPQLEKLFNALAAQNMQDFELILVCDRKFEEDECGVFEEFVKKQSLPNEKVRLFSHLNSDFIPQSAGGASYVRNFGILQARGEFIQLFDDDNTFGTRYLTTALEKYKKHKKPVGEEVITPTLLRRDSGNIQNQGFGGYNYRLARPQVHFLPQGKSYGVIQMFSGNGVFAKAELMKKVLYDEQIAWIAEDLDFVYRLRKAGAEILVFADLEIYHWEREKNILEQARIGTQQSARQKIRNIFLRVKKHANRYQKLIFLLRSSWGITGRLAIKALWHGKGARRTIFKGVIQGYFSGWETRISK